jgi:hypothetical protein
MASVNYLKEPSGKRHNRIFFIVQLFIDFSSLHADYWGNKSFWNARYVTVSLDLSPKQMIEITDSLKEEEPVMRVFVHKIRTAADRLETKTYKMPFQDLPFPKLPKQKI